MNKEVITTIFIGLLVVLIPACQTEKSKHKAKNLQNQTYSEPADSDVSQVSNQDNQDDSITKF